MKSNRVTEHLAFDRLRKDATFLLQAGRAESSIILSTFAFELAGKMLIRRWRTGGGNHHLTKQKMAASLMTTLLMLGGLEEAGLEIVKAESLEGAQQRFHEAVQSSPDAKANWDDVVSAAMAKGVIDWPHSRILQAIHAGWLHRAKNDVSYGAEELGATPEEYCEAATAMVKMCEMIGSYLGVDSQADAPKG